MARIVVGIVIAAVLGGLPFESQAASPNAPLFVARAAYRAEPQNDRLLLTAELELRQSVAGQQTMPLDLGAASLESATLDGQPAPLLRTADGRVVLVNTKTGTSTLQLRLSMPLHRVGRDRSAILRPIGNAPATLTVDIPADRSLWIDGKPLSRAKPLAEKIRHTLAVGNRRSVELRFASVKASHTLEASGTLDSVVLAESRSTLAISAGLADWQCETRFHVTGTPRKTFESSIAGPMQVTGVTGADVSDWSVLPSKDDPSRSTVRVTFRRPFTGVRTVTYSGRTALPTEPFWQVPNFVIAGVDSHAGHVAVSFPRGEAIRVDEFAGLRQSAGMPEGPRPKIVPVNSVSMAAGVPPLGGLGCAVILACNERRLKAVHQRVAARKVLAFDFWKQDFELNLVLPKRKHTAAADAVTILDVRRRRVRMEFTAAWESHESQRWASLSLPAEWSIRSLAVNGRPADWKTLPVEAAVQHLRIALPARKSRSVSARPDLDPRNRVDWHVPAHPGPDGPSGPTFARLTVTAVRELEYPDRTDAAAVWKLPVVRLPESRLVRGELFIRGSNNVSIGLSDAKELTPIPGRHGFVVTGFSRSRDRLKPVTTNIQSGDRYAYRYVLQPKPGAGFSAIVAVRPKQPAFSVASLTIARLDRSALRATHEIEVTPVAGGFRTLELLLPKDAGQQTPIRWKGADARLLHGERVSAEGGRARWKLTFDRNVHHPGRLLLDLTSPRPNARAAMKVDCVQFPDADRTTGYIVVLTGERQHLSIAANYAVPSANDGGKSGRRPLPLVEVSVGEAVARFAGHNRKNGDRSIQRRKAESGKRKAEGEAVQASGFPLPPSAFHSLSPRGRAIAAYRYVVPKIDVSITESRLSGDATVPLICRRRSLRTIVTSAGAMQHHVKYELQGSGPRELSVQLPEGAELWAALCDGRPLAVRRAGSSLLLPLSRGWLDPDRMTLELIYHQKTAALGRTGRLQLEPPTIAVASDGSPLVIRRSGWSVHHPGNVDLTEAAGEFRAVHPLDRSGWLKRLGAWTAANSLTLLALLLAVPFAWIAVRFLQTVVRRGNRIPSWPRFAGFLLAAGILVAVALSGRWSANNAVESTGLHERAPATVNGPEIGGRKSEVGSRSNSRGLVLSDLRPPTSDLRLPEPHLMAVKRFEYLGIADDETTLELAYETRTGGVALRLCVIAGMLLAFWMLRHRGRQRPRKDASPPGHPGRLLGSLAVVGLALPPALAGWSPVEWQPYLDGVFFGTLACGAAWGLATVIGGAKRRSGSIASLRFGVAARGLARLLPPTVLFVTGSQALAADMTHAVPNGFASAANYEISINSSAGGTRGSAQVTARFDVMSLREGPASIALPLGRVAVAEATLDGKTAAINWRTVNKLAVPFVIVPKPGRHRVQLKFSLPLEADEATARFLLPLRPVASGRAVLTLPSKQQPVRLRGLAGTFQRAIRNGESIIEFPVDKCRDVTVDLREAAKPAPANAVVVVDSATCDVDVKDSGVFQRDEMTLRVVNGGFDDWTFDVPDDRRVIGISGNDVAGWELSPAKSTNRAVRIDFRRKIDKSTTVAFHLFRPAEFTSEPATIALQPVRAASAMERERTVSVHAGREFVVAEGKTVAAKRRREATRTLAAPGSLRRSRVAASTLTWTLTEPDASVAVQVSRRTPQSAVTAEHAVLVDAHEVRIASRLSFDFLGSPRTKLSLQLPEGYTLHSLRGTHGAEWSHGADETTAIVVFPKPQSGTVRVVLEGTLQTRGVLATRGVSSSTVQVPLPGPMAAYRLDVTAGVWLAAGLTARVKAASGWNRVAMARSDRLQPVDGGASRRNAERSEPNRPAEAGHYEPPLGPPRCSGRKMDLSPSAFGFPISNRRPVAVLRTTSTEPAAIALEVAEPRSTVTGESLTLVRVTNTAVHYTMLMKWSGVAGARRSVAFSVPGWIGRRLDLRLNRSLRIEPHATNGSDDRMQWIVTDFSRRALAPGSRESHVKPGASARRLIDDSVVVIATATLPPPLVQGNRVAAPKVQLQRRPFVVTGFSRSRDRLKPVTTNIQGGDDQSAAYVAVARSQHFVVLANESNARLQRPKVQKFRPFPAADLSRQFRISPELQRRISKATERLRVEDSAVPPVWTLQPVLPADRVEAVVHRAELTTTLERDGCWRLQAVYRMKNGRRPYFAVKLPDNSRLVSAVVAGRTVRTGRLQRNGHEYVVVPLPVAWTSVHANESGVRRPESVRLAWTEVHATIAGRLPDEAMRAAGLRSMLDGSVKLSLPAPRVVSRDDDAELGIPVQETLWTVHLADGLHVVSGQNADCGLRIPDRVGRAQLSNLDMPIPRRGQTLTFRKAGGDPQLTLRVRTREATQKRRRILWSIVWLAFGGVALLAVRRKTAPART